MCEPAVGVANIGDDGKKKSWKANKQKGSKAVQAGERRKAKKAKKKRCP